MSRGLGKKTIALREAVLDVLAAFDGPMSSRQVAYQLVGRRAIENTESEKKRVGRLIVDMRRDGSIPYSRIVDRTRAKHHFQGWDGLGELMETFSSDYRRDLWTDQPVIPMIACEKAALEGIFSGIVDEYGSSLWTFQGFISESFAYEWAEEIRRLNRAGKNVAIYYFGDFDPSGLVIEEDARGKLHGFGAGFEWRREGLLLKDFDEFNLVRVPVKRDTDTRAKAFLSKFGDRAAELDALSPAELEARIRLAILEHIDHGRWQATKTIERSEREAFNLVAENWDTAVAAARSAA